MEPLKENSPKKDYTPVWSWKWLPEIDESLESNTMTASMKVFAKILVMTPSGIAYLLLLPIFFSIIFSVQLSGN